MAKQETFTEEELNEARAIASALIPAEEGDYWSLSAQELLIGAHLAAQLQAREQPQPPAA